MGWKVYHFIFVGKNILSFISTWLRFSYTCHKGCLNTWLGDRKLREAKLRCFFKASKTVASPGRWLMWCTAKTLRCSIPSRLTLERPKRLSCDLVIDAIDSATLSPPTIKKPLRVSLQQPCWDKCLSNFNSSCTKPFLGMVLKGENRWRIWLTPFKLGTSATFAPTMCASSKNVIIPTPPHPNPMTCVAPTMCASARNMMLRSTDHVCKCKERYHPHPTPPQPHPIPWLA